MKKSLTNQTTIDNHHLKCVPVFNNIIKPKFTSGYQPKGKYLYRDVLWSVLPEEHDQEPTIMKRLFDTVDRVSAMSRFLAVRYDLRVPTYSADNLVIDTFHQLLFERLGQTYPKSFISHLWVREQGQGEAQHYHYLLMLDGNHIRYPNKLNAMVQHCWEQATGGSVWFPENGYYFVTPNDVETYSKLILRVSYLGKKRSKGSIAAGIKIFGSGLRKPKRVKPHTEKNSPASIHSIGEEPIDYPSDTSLQSAQAMNNAYRGMLDKYFTGKAKLLSFHRPYARNELYDERKWWDHYHPRWPTLRSNYLSEALITGISLSQYARKYHLSPERVYANCRNVGGQSLKIIHWAWHRYCFLKSKSTLANYIKNNQLHHKTAARQLRRKPMSVFWSQHFDNYYQTHWPEGWTVADYCRKYNLAPSTARRYMVAFPFIGLINPFLLKPWL